MAARIVGVYSIPGHADVALVEVEVDRPPSEVNVGEFTQESSIGPLKRLVAGLLSGHDPKDRANWQAPYDERYLSADGTREMQPSDEVPLTTRLVFFFHFLDTRREFITPDGAVAVPPVQQLPARLAFVEYEPPD